MWTAAFVLPVLAAAALIVFGPDENAAPEAPLETSAVALPAAPAGPPLRVTPAVRRRIAKTIERFSATAVVRRDLDEAWTLASPTMRLGLTRAGWLRGEIPVVPFPAEALGNVDWRVVERYPKSLLADVVVHPKPGSRQNVIVYSVELSAAGHGAGQRFLVDTWVPLGSLGSDLSPMQSRSGSSGRVEPNPLAFDDARLGPEWFLVPAGIAGLLVIFLLGLGVRGVVVRRRAERRHREYFRR